MSLDPRNHNWEKELEGGLPDCRVRPMEREAARIVIGKGWWDKVFCANCGEPSGAVPPNCPHVFFICGTCVGQSGPPPGCVQVSE